MSYDVFRNSVNFVAPQPINQTGQIYIKDNYIFIVEPSKGIHFVDNTNPSDPQKIGFLNVIGCKGMAIKGSYLYVNSFIDLVIIDISNLHAPFAVKRIEDLFPKILPPSNNSYPYTTIEKEKGVVIGWEVKEVKEQISQQPQGDFYGAFTTFDSNSNISESTTGGSGTGVSGSITKFTIINSHLYIMEGNQLYSIGISNPLSATTADPISIWRTVETLFPHENYIFMGTTNGMLIYSVENPDQPTFVADVDHMSACDPVVVKGNHAYVTIREGRDCGGSINQLDIIDISNISQPVLKNSYNMHNPHGLGINQNLLFVCDGAQGLKIFDATIPELAGENLIKHFESIHAIDVIPLQDILILIANDGLYQYNYSNPQEIYLLSTIQFN